VNTYDVMDFTRESVHLTKNPVYSVSIVTKNVDLVRGQKEFCPLPIFGQRLHKKG
jgi:hypothetical protein